MVNVTEYRGFFFFFFLRNSDDRSSKSIDDPYGMFRERTIGPPRDEKSCRWVQIDDVNGPPASRGGWLVEVKCECVSCRREADKDEEGWRRKQEYN